jgi:hypothetical protein
MSEGVDSNEAAVMVRYFYMCQCAVEVPLPPGTTAKDIADCNGDCVTLKDGTVIDIPPPSQNIADYDGLGRVVQVQIEESRSGDVLYDSADDE